MRSLLLTLLTASTLAQPPLSEQLRAIAADARGQVSIACSLPGTPLDCNLHPGAHPPMQSVFKLPLVLTLLHQVEQGRFTLDQPIRFRPEDRILPKPYSPLQDQYPDANVDLPLRTLIQMTVGLSDNTAADLLLRLAGGPPAVNAYTASLGVLGFHLQDDERALHAHRSLQYRNWFTPAGAVQLLRRLADNSPLTPGHTSLLLGWMTPATPSTRIQAGLPPGTTVPHKSGTSDEENGIAPATNDIALIPLPDGRRLALAVFVTHARADQTTREQVIARIAQATYTAAIHTP